MALAGEASSDAFRPSTEVVVDATATSRHSSVSALGQGTSNSEENEPPTNGHHAMLSSLVYRELQQRAKAQGVRANQKREVLIAALEARARV